jgi:hypothetical protein
MTTTKNPRPPVQALSKVMDCVEMLDKLIHKLEQRVDENDGQIAELRERIEALERNLP